MMIFFLIITHNKPNFFEKAIGGHWGPLGKIEVYRGPLKGRRGTVGAIPGPFGAVGGSRGPFQADGPKGTFNRAGL